MKDILIVAHFTQVPGEKGNGRFNYIANKLGEYKVNVELVTTRFSHRTKKKRPNICDNETFYKLTLIDEPGYQKNVSVLRFYSHYSMGKNLLKYLNKRELPDIIYCAVPSLSVGYVVTKYAKRNNIKLIIDIQDLWPEAFNMILTPPFTFIGKFLFYPMTKFANYIYKNADEIVGVSQTYVDRALSICDKKKESHVVYLGTELKEFDEYFKKNDEIVKPNNELWLVYIGTLGHSYDIASVIDALKILSDKGLTNIKFIIMGDGPLRDKFEEYAEQNKIDAKFIGRVDYSKMVRILSECDIAINPIRKGSAGSIINKVGDYAAAGLPIVNTQESDEFRSLLSKYNAGVNCINGNPFDIAQKIEFLANNEDIRNIYGIGSRKLAEDKFDREKNYIRIINTLINNS